MNLPEIVVPDLYDSNLFCPELISSKKRKVSMFELEVPLEDGGTAYINDSAEKISTNTITCAKPGQTRYTKFPLKCLYIHIVVNQGILFNILMNLPTFIKTGRADKYRQLFSEMIAYSRNLSQISDIAMYSRLLEIIYMMVEDSHGKNLTIQKKNEIYVASIIEKTLIYIEEHLTEDLSLKTLATMNGVSPVHFHNIFKESTRKNLRSYVEERRIKKAVALLMTTDYTLTRIAYECGFSSQSYFNYAFKRRMNCSPREYIRKLSNEKNFSDT